MASKAGSLWCFIAVLFGDLDCGYRPNWPKAHLVKVEMSVRAFELDCGRLPYSIDELYGVVGAAQGCSRPLLWPSEYQFHGMTVHYWKNEADSTFQLRLLGRDGVFGSADDVTIDPEPHVWGGTLIEQRKQRRAMVLFALLSAVAVLHWWCTRRQRASGPER